MAASKAVRLREFYQRLRTLPAAAGFEEAWTQISRTLNQVEDEMSGVPYDPSKWQTDDRLYPPQRDSERAFSGYPKVRRENGSIEIRTLTNQIVFSKTGADGKGVMEQ
ncbi:MAG: hypothetical protein DMG30_20575 [Acidobacteria bacterium]|nr:MAG: hypothetical protein DMG30_20575 [Acidobacteriota bacterium]